VCAPSGSPPAGVLFAPAVNNFAMIADGTPAGSEPLHDAAVLPDGRYAPIPLARQAPGTNDVWTDRTPACLPSLEYARAAGLRLQPQSRGRVPTSVYPPVASRGRAREPGALPGVRAYSRRADRLPEPAARSRHPNQHPSRVSSLAGGGPTARRDLDPFRVMPHHPKHGSGVNSGAARGRGHACGSAHYVDSLGRAGP